MVWRLLVKQYNPSGGMYEVDAMMALMTLTAVRDLTALPGAVAKFERDYRLYEKRFGRLFLEEFKVPAFFGEMKWKFASDLTDYHSRNTKTKKSIISNS